MKIGTAKAMDDRVMQDSVVQWIKSMPEGWQLRRLGDISLKIGSGVTPKGGATVYLERGIPLFRSQNIHFYGLALDDVAFISEETHQEMKGSHVKNNDILLNVTGASIGRCFYFAKECGFKEANVNQHVCIIRPSRQILYKFLHYFMMSNIGQSQIFSSFRGSSREGLNFKDLKLFKLGLPSRKEQQAIAHYLDQQCGKLDAVITIKQQQIKTLDALRQSVIYQAVTKGLDATVPLVGSGVEWLGDIPLGWRIERLKDIANINENTLDAKTPDDYLLQYIEISNVNSQGIVSDQAIEEIEFSAAPSRAKRRVFPGDTIISSVRPNLQAIAYIERDESNLVCSTGFYVVNTKFTHLLDNKFAYYFLLSVNSKQYFESVAKGVGYPSVDDRDFKSLHTMLPPVAEQQAIANHLDQETQRLDTLKANLNQQISTLQAYKKSLIYECVTGKKRLAGYA